MNDQHLKAQLMALENTRSIDHSGRNFLQHLFMVYEILRVWGNSPTVSCAGLFHSIYGTEFFKTSVFDKTQRSELQLLLGQEAEALSYAFCFLNRSDIQPTLLQYASSGSITLLESDGKTLLEISTLQLQQLLTIEMANLLEQLCQADRSPAIFLSRLSGMANAGAILSPQHPVYLLASLSLEQEQVALSMYHQALAAVTKQQATDMLKQVQEIIPAIGEVQILLAALALDNKQFCDALLHASQGCSLLRHWASPWDKRLLLSDWLGLGERAQELACAGVMDVHLWPRLQQMLTTKHLSHAL